MTIPGRENARQTGRSGRASNAVKIAHFNASLAQAIQGETRWLPGVKSCAGQLLLALIDCAHWAEVVGGKAPEGMTPRGFDALAHSMRQAAYVHRLRQGGWQIDTELCDASNKFENVQHASYSLTLDMDVEGSELAAWMKLAREVRGVA